MKFLDEICDLSGGNVIIQSAVRGGLTPGDEILRCDYSTE